jgi:hypothetical protein
VGANETTIVLLHNQDTPGPIKERLLEHRGPRSLAAEYQDSSAAIPRDANDGAVQPFHNGQRSAPEQWLIVPVQAASPQLLRRCVSHLYR